MHAGRVDEHLVQRPRVLEVDDQRLAEPASDRTAVAPVLYGATEAWMTSTSPSSGRRARQRPRPTSAASAAGAAASARTGSPSARRRRLGRRQPVDRGPQAVVGQRLVGRQPAEVHRAGPGDDGRRPACVGQVAGELEVALHARAAGRREAVGEHQDVAARPVWPPCCRGHARRRARAPAERSCRAGRSRRRRAGARRRARSRSRRRAGRSRAARARSRRTGAPGTWRGRRARAARAGRRDGRARRRSRTPSSRSACSSMNLNLTSRNVSIRSVPWM